MGLVPLTLALFSMSRFRKISLTCDAKSCTGPCGPPSQSACWHTRPKKLTLKHCKYNSSPLFSHPRPAHSRGSERRASN